MKNTWLFVWLILLVLQFITYLLDKQWARKVAEVDLELLELARTTNAEWQNLLPIGEAYTPPAEGEILFARESLFMQLRELETYYRSIGAEMEVTDILKKWYSINESQFDGLDFHEYLKVIEHLMNALRHGQEDCLVERIQLFPDIKSDYPSIVIEMEGMPSVMGRSFMNAVVDARSLGVVGIDLNKSADEGAWWMLGSCRYDPEAF